MRLTILVLVVLGVGSCNAARARVTDVTPFQWSDHEGVWVSSGYGYAVDARGDAALLYHVTRDVCVENPRGEVSILDFFDLYRSENVRTLLLSSVLDPFVYTFHRADSLPATCASPAPNTPLDNFDAFAAYYAEHYAFFDLYGVDWAPRTALARQLVTPDMSDRALFEVMSDLLRPLRDSHIKLEAEIDGEELVYDGNPGKTDLAIAAWAERNASGGREAVGRFRRAYWFDDIRDTLLGGAGTITGNGRIQYGMVAQDVGYIAS